MNMRIKSFFLILCLISINFYSLSQNKALKISEELKEISGLEILNDSTLIAINDSGNKPELFFLNLNGEIFHKIHLKNAQNIDWEDITLDDKNNLYVGDVGNNSQKRKAFTIYYFSLDSILFKDTIGVKLLMFTYSKIAKNQEHFDCESIAYHNNKIYLFIKSKILHKSQQNLIFSLDVNQKVQEALFFNQFTLKRNRNYLLDAITSVDIEKDTCYLLTYSDVYVFPLYEKFLKPKRKYSFGLLSQKEAICVNDKYLFIGNENSYKIRKQKIKKIKK
jgi:hypothetical protein